MIIFQIVCVFSRFLGEFCQKFCCRLAGFQGIFDAVQGGEVEAGYADYLEKDRAYRCEENVFEDFSDEERDAAFGKPPATVWENVKIMKANPDKVAALTRGGTLSEKIVDSFLASIVYRWKNELIDRIIPGVEAAVRGYKKLDNDDKIDERRWKSIKAKRVELAKDLDDEKCICTRLKEALEKDDYDTASDLQLEMMKKAQALEKEYHVYALNILD